MIISMLLLKTEAERLNNLFRMWQRRLNPAFLAPVHLLLQTRGAYKLMGLGMGQYTHRETIRGQCHTGVLNCLVQTASAGRTPRKERLPKPFEPGREGGRIWMGQRVWRERRQPGQRH